MEEQMNDLEKYFAGNQGRLIFKWKHYFEVYDRHFARFRGTDVHVVEFGVYQGGSLQMWKHYFGPKCRVYGVDINPHCKQAEEDRIEIIIGDQEDRSFLRSLARQIPRIDILIDDGGHWPKQQIATFEELFSAIQPNGLYLCEDIHTAYWKNFDGGFRRPGTFIEYGKALIDQLNAWHSKEPKRFKVTDFTRTAHSLHFYDSILVIEKRPIEPPSRVSSGKAEIPEWSAPVTAAKRFRRNLKRKLRAWLGLAGKV
jgi:hypothetical protein